NQGRDLVAERLPAAGGHEHHRVAPAADVVDDRRLLAAEGVVAEDAPQDVERGGGGVGEHDADGKRDAGTGVARTGVADRGVPVTETRCPANGDSPRRDVRLTAADRTTHRGGTCDSPGWIVRLTAADRATHRGGSYDSPGWNVRLTL